ncbi:MAG TPA: ABC transporter substrate-binding protein [Sedimentibacter sp.]|jgi:NitT/TauT family transport system substrate-binding protein|nr:ABC transporter substrate-binding protein [Sedimentibacter sp.]HPV84944.1 ABC transporter substrate-binding protein [Sedimentibacter sp.]HQO71618.1 ABC transporter substrate-binding protein [Sedimentibacter sp.]HQO94932.1 ABC transporter substrate-binding protein [Sedimentibacter sp.]
MKKTSFLLVVLFVLIFTAGCNNGPAETPTPDENAEETPMPEEPADVKPVNVTIAGLKGPTSIGMIKMIDEKALKSDKYNVEYIQESAPDSLTGKIINGDIQISSVPINLASVLYNKTQGKVQLLAVNTIGNLYIVGTEDISSVSQLEGKTLGMSAKGSTPDFAMNYILKQAGLEGKTELNYALDHATLAQSVIAEDTRVALLPQPFVTQTTLKNPNVKMLIDLNEAWNDATGGKSELFTGCIIINKEFAENNPEFVDEFLKQYENSVNWVLENQKEASVLTAKHEIMPDAVLVEKALPYCGITFRKAAEAKESLNNFYQILFDSNPASVGGSMPDDEFYFKE